MTFLFVFSGENIGYTTELLKRLTDHKNLIGSAFTSKYKCQFLVHLEAFESISPAVKREKQLNNWRRDWKDELITSHNPGWEDLFPKFFG